MIRTKVFISYAHEDDGLRGKRLVSQLGVLVRQGLIAAWNDQSMRAGDDLLNEKMLAAGLLFS